MNIKDVKRMNPSLFDWEHCSRHTGETVLGLYIKDDGEFNLPRYLRLTPKGWSKETAVCPRTGGEIAIALEYTNGEWFWMHIIDYTGDNND